MRGSDAGIAQLVEHDLAKVGVASSSLVSRSRFNARGPDPIRALSFPLSGHEACADATGAAQSYSQALRFCYHLRLRCGNSSVGRARPCQGRGREFESRFPLQDLHGTPGHRGFVFRGICDHLRVTVIACIKQRPGGRVVMQRTANPRTPVRFRPRPPLHRGCHGSRQKARHRRAFCCPGEVGARGGGRTRMALRPRDFKSLAYTGFATRAGREC